MSVLCMANTLTRARAANHPANVALHDLGARPAQTLQESTQGYTHLLVTIDKFTKWIEAKPITRVRSVDAVDFFLNIVYRFGVPNSIITNNDTLFTEKKFL